MGRTRIKRIIRTERKPKYVITYVELEHGGEASGFGEDWRVGEEVIEVWHERYNKVKILKDTH